MTGAAARDATPPSPETLSASATSAQRGGDHARAAELWRQVLDANPQNAAALAGLAQALQAQGRIEAAEQVWRDGAARLPDRADLHAGLAKLLRGRGDAEGALAALGRAFELEPGHVGHQMERGAALLALRRLDEAETAFREVLRNSPSSGPAHNALADVLRERGEHALALALYEAAARRSPENPWYRNSAAGQLRALGRLEEAIERYHEVIAAAPDFVHGWSGLAEALRTAGDREGALSAYETAAELAPANPSYRMEAGALRLALGQPERAEAAFRAALAIEPSLAAAQNALGDALAPQNRREEALEAYRAAVAAAPDNAWYRCAAANQLRELGRLDEAVSAFQDLTTRHPGFTPAHLGLAETFRRRGEPQRAVEALQAAIALEPGHVAARLALAEAWLTASETGRAEALYDALLAESPGLTEAWLGKGRIARLDNRDDVAAACFEKASADLDSAAAQVEWAQCQLRRNDAPAAREILDRATTRRPNDKHLWIHRAYIERAAGQPERSLEIFLACTARFPLDPGFPVEASIDCMSLGSTHEALQWLERALNLDPAFGPALIWLASLWEIANQCDRAALTFARLAELRPLPRDILLRACRLDASLGRYEAALQRLGFKDGVSPADPDILATASTIAMEHGLYEDARVYIDQALAMRPNDFTLRLLDLELAARTDAPQQARARIESLRSQFENEPRFLFLEAQQARAELDFERAADRAAHCADAPGADAAAAELAAQIDLLCYRLADAQRRLQAFVRRSRGASALQGGGDKVSQTHTGQIYIEYRLDLEALRETRGAREDGLNALAGVLSKYADYTPAAVEFLAGVRRSRRETAPASDLAEPSKHIPQTIAQYWESGSLDADVGALCATWTRTNPDFVYERFGLTSALRFLETHLGPEVVSAFRRAREPAQRAHVFKLAYLRIRGGVFADIDTRCVAAIPLVGSASFQCLWDNRGGVAGDFLAATPAHPIITAALQEAATNLNQGDKGINWLSTGGGLISRAVARYMAERLTAGHDFSDIVTHEPNAASRFLRTQCSLAYKRKRSESARGHPKGPQGRWLQELERLSGIAGVAMPPPANAPSLSLTRQG